MLLLIFPFRAVNSCLICSGAPVLGAYVFTIVISSLDLSLDHYVASLLFLYFKNGTKIDLQIYTSLGVQHSGLIFLYTTK